MPQKLNPKAKYNTLQSEETPMHIYNETENYDSYHHHPTSKFNQNSNDKKYYS